MLYRLGIVFHLACATISLAVFGLLAWGSIFGTTGDEPFRVVVFVVIGLIFFAVGRAVRFVLSGY